MSRWGIIDNSLEGRQRIYFPHWSRGLCPTEPEANRLHRNKCWQLSDAKQRAEVKRMCAEDLLFYIYTFVYIFRAMGSDPRPIPFNPYDFQVEVFTALWKCLHDGQEDLRAVKPRYVGFTWQVIVLFEHCWHFQRNRHLLLGTRNANELDGAMRSGEALKVGEWSRLLPKVDFIHLYQPKWLLPMGYVPREEPWRTKMLIVNPELQSMILGESANPKFGRSGRFYGIGFDEHGHTDHGYEIIGSCSRSSECHMWWSTPDGPATAHAMLGRAPMRQIRLEWWMVPEHAEGMTLDPSKPREGRSSPWLEKELARIGYDPVTANNEIWADETQQAGGYYSPVLFDLLMGSSEKPGTVQPPSMAGELDIHVGPNGPWVTRWCDQANGQWKLWLHFDVDGRPPRDDRYIMGVDVAAGTTDGYGRGYSNSAIVVISERTRAKVAEFATHAMLPHKLAEVVTAAVRWFAGSDETAFLIYDAAGPGDQMGRVIEEDFKLVDNVYRRTDSTGHMKPGYIKPTNMVEARRPWGGHESMLWSGRYVERSVDCVGEMRFYNHNPTGGAPVHLASKNVVDPSGARANHGDRTTATVMALIELAKRDAEPEREPDLPPWGSIKHMKMIREDREREALLI